MLLFNSSRNSLFAVLTTVAMQFVLPLSGALVIEFAFARHGISQLVIEALWTSHSPPMQFYVHFISATDLTKPAVDGFYGVIDPRIRHQ